MPLTSKGEEILAAMKKTYGSEGERVFYKSKNAGTITGVDAAALEPLLTPDRLSKADAIATRCDAMPPVKRYRAQVTHKTLGVIVVEASGRTVTDAIISAQNAAAREWKAPSSEGALTSVELQEVTQS